MSRPRASEATARLTVGPDEVTMFLRYEDVKRILRDYRTFSSATPFRVPIPSEEDLRPTAQYPIETDPPAHTAYRALMDRHFSRAAAQSHRSSVETRAHELIASSMPTGRIEVVRDYALPLFLHALALTLGVPTGHTARWLTWGVQALSTQTTDGLPGNEDMLAYIDEMADAAISSPGDDFFGHLARSVLLGRRLTRDEIRGFANLAFAGGRQTVVYATTTALDYLASHPADQQTLRHAPDAIPQAVEEFLRWVTPIVHLGRTVTRETEVGGVTLQPGDLVSVCYYTANLDGDAFGDPDRVLLHRRPNRHVAFGHGPHTCAGAPLARMVLDVAVRTILTVATEITHVHQVIPRVEQVGDLEFIIGFDRLELGLR